MTAQRFDIPDQPVLVGGATGAVGREVVRALLERGTAVRVFVRSPQKVAALPPHVERVAGTLADRDALARALRGVAAAFFVAPHDVDEEHLAVSFVGACEAARVRLVFSGVHADGGNAVVRLFGRLMYRRLLPHYAAKFRISERVRNSDADPVVLSPGNYYQTDEICRAQLEAGCYPLPFRRMLRVDTRDVGDAAARALLDASVASGGYALVGPASLGGAEIAANWSAALGRPVRYAPDAELADRLLDAAYDARKAHDGRATMRALAELELETAPAQLAQTQYLLGRPPRSHAGYAADTAAVWAAERCGAAAHRMNPERMGRS
jgi:uncharacterized protein YbjT (DUF2867 family)